jgi:hypothetical protein
MAVGAGSTGPTGVLRASVVHVGASTAPGAAAGLSVLAAVRSAGLRAAPVTLGDAGARNHQRLGSARPDRAGVRVAVAGGLAAGAGGAGTSAKRFSIGAVAGGLATVGAAAAVGVGAVARDAA